MRVFIAGALFSQAERELNQAKSVVGCENSCELNSCGKILNYSTKILIELE